MVASRVAAQLSQDEDVSVTTVPGGLGEFSVLIDGEKVINFNRFLYPTTRKMVAATRTFLAKA